MEEDVRTSAGGSAFSPATRRAAVAVGLTATAVVLLLFLWKAITVLLLVFAAVLVAVLLHGLAERLGARTGLSPGWALAAVGVGLAGLLVLGGWLMGAQLSSQLNQLSQTIPQSLEKLRAQLGGTQVGAFLVQRIPPPEQLLSGQGSLFSRVTGVASLVLGALTNLLFVLIGGLYLAASPGLYRRGLLKLVPVQGRARAAEVLEAVGSALWGWLVGTLTSMLIIGVLTTVGLLLLGVPLALALGLIAGLLEFIPLLGPFASAVPAVLVAFVAGPDTALYVALLYLGVQQLESNLITPLVMKEAVDLPPALTLAGAFVAGVLFGLPGVILATPLVVTVRVLVQKLYVEDVLGDRNERR